jgi:hypothetical protein
MNMQVRFSQELLIAAPQFFKQHGLETGIHFVGALHGENHTTNVLFVNAESQKTMPAAVTKDRSVVESAIEQNRQNNSGTASLEGQLKYIANLEEMMNQPVYKKTVPQDLFDAIASNKEICAVTGQQIPPEKVMLISGISYIIK